MSWRSYGNQDEIIETITPGATSNFSPKKDDRCKNKCKLHKGKQHIGKNTKTNDVLCTTCGIY